MKKYAYGRELTRKLATEFTGKIVKTFYNDFNSGEDIFLIVAVDKDAIKAINFKDGKPMLPYPERFFADAITDKQYTGLMYDYDAKLDLNTDKAIHRDDAEYKESPIPTINELLAAGRLVCVETTDDHTKVTPHDNYYFFHDSLVRGSGAERLMVMEVYEVDEYLTVNA